MILETVVSLAEARKKREARARAKDRAVMSESLDPEALALAVCCDLAAAGDDRPRQVSLAAIARRSHISEADVIVGAAYGQVRGWLMYSSYSVMLTDDGREFVASRVPQIDMAGP